MMFDQRCCGIFLHLTSLPGPWGSGELGPAAEDFVERIAAAGLSLWQMLPLGPVGGGNSPYSSTSAFAGNYHWISIQRLLDEGLLQAQETDALAASSAAGGDLGALMSERERLIRLAVQRRAERADPDWQRGFADFCREQQHWLDNFALFNALKRAHEGRAWPSWPAALAQREEAELARVRIDLAPELAQEKRLQYVFFTQWAALHGQCRRHGVRLIGDAPIFIAHDSADVWQRPALFSLNADGTIAKQAGAPPDYFNPAGQCWGNPLYRWDKHPEAIYDWWAARLAWALRHCDVLRIDHFRGFAAVWAIDGGDSVSANGAWQPGPGAAFFERMRAELGSLPFIAEDLGVITEDVYAMRDRFELPGMGVMVFGLEDEHGGELHRPERYPERCVGYTSIHDSDTFIGMYHSLLRCEGKAAFARRYLLEDGLGNGADGKAEDEVHWAAINRLLASNAEAVIIPAQDLLGLGSAARMNIPGTAEGNWTWRLEEALPAAVLRRLGEMIERHERGPTSES